MGNGEAPQDPAIERAERSGKGRYFTRLDGVEAEMTYSVAGGHTLVIDHTGVPDALRGRGVGQALVARAVEDARRERRKILPLCPFARAQISRRPEWQDVLGRSGGSEAPPPPSR